MDSAPEFTTPTEAEGEAIRKYLEIETEYMAAAGFFTHSPNALIRSRAVAIIATNSPIVDSDAFIAYLAMNYFDRYFSKNQFQDVQDVRSDSEKLCLIALCCLFISAKMRLKTLSVDQFLMGKSLNFTQKRIMELELKILDVLNWQMRPVTAFLYLNYYYRLFKSLGGFKRRCINEIIVQAQGENQFVCYKPSQIAMSAFLVAAQIAYPSEYNKHHYQEEEELSECVRALGDLCGRMNIEIEPQVKSQEVEDEHSSEEVEDEHSSEEAEDEHSSEEIEEEAELPIGQTQDKGKKVVVTHETGTAQGEAEELPSDEQIASITDEIGNKTHSEEGSLDRNIVEVTEGEREVSEEEKQRLAKGKAVAVSETSNEEERRLAKGKAVAVSESSDEETQPSKSILEEQKENLDKEEQEILVTIEAAIKLGMRKVDKGAQVGRSSELQTINESEKLMNFDLKWSTDVPLLESGEPLTVILQTSPNEVQGTADNKVCCGQCSIL